tara:strand:- start:141 stop:797 length:657 start_codon:yes stop_codon:yes gene_type:complete
VNIGITMRVIAHKEYNETRDALSHDWFRLINDLFNNSLLIPIPNNIDIAGEIISGLKLDGIILSNGNDIGDSVIRDEVEKKIFEVSMNNNIPIFAVCRGFQYVNYLLNGSVTKYISDKVKDCHIANDHSVTLFGNMFVEIIKSPEIIVNSYHKHGILRKDLSKELKHFAVTKDDVVEGFYHLNSPILGIQWHPERKSKSFEFDKNIMVKFFKEGMFWL